MHGTPPARRCRNGPRTARPPGRALPPGGRYSAAGRGISSHWQRQPGSSRPGGCAVGNQGICRIGVFYDGSYFQASQNYFYHNRQLGWLDFRAFHPLLQEYVRTKEPGFVTYKVVYAAWFQGLFTSTRAEDHKLRRDRNLHHDLMHAGIEVKYLPMSTSNSEKGTDVALAVDALQVGLRGQIDVAVLASGDGDFVPLVRELMRNGVRVLVAYFDYEDGQYKSFANERLLASANYELDINELETDKEFRTLFKALFKTAPKTVTE